MNNAISLPLGFCAACRRTRHSRPSGCNKCAIRLVLNGGTVFIQARQLEKRKTCECNTRRRGGSPSLSPRRQPSLGGELSARTRRSSSGKDDQHHCFNHKRGQCWKDHNCEAWRPPVCIFQKKNQCSAGYQCPFVHLSKDDRRVPEGKEKETTSKTPTRSVNRRKLVGNSLHDQEVHATVWTVQLRETLSEGQRRTK